MTPPTPLDPTPSLLTTYSLEELLSTTNTALEQALVEQAYQTKLREIGPQVHLRGLIELSNKCLKDCFYCGIRKSNPHTPRYSVPEQEVFDAAQFALTQGYGSLVIQSGEQRSEAFAQEIAYLVREIKTRSRGRLGITLSCGEQDLEVYQRWFEAGAHRYLLRIESSNPELYQKIHPKDALHRFEKRVEALHDLRRAGFQVGTGVMIGLPFQTIEDLANDLRFIRHLDVDMVGMGPYLAHPHTPLYAFRHLLRPESERLTLALRMVSLLRLLMPTINIAATTALQTIDPDARERAILGGANIIMPNMTGVQYRAGYQIYDHKPGIDQDAAETKAQLTERLARFKIPIAWNQWGDSRHFTLNKKTQPL